MTVSGTPSGTARRRCYFVLSVKSSGSSIVQRKLADAGSARLLHVDDHAENETLFWVKAASILGLPQHRMEHSEVPFSPGEARRRLTRLLRNNLPAVPPIATKQDLFDAWSALVRAGDGDLVEKSPHHLYQPAAIALMEEYADQAPNDIEVRFIGLVRNPTETLYSSWRRFGVAPEREEVHWVRAYRTLADLVARRPEQVVSLRYDDLVTGRTSLEQKLGISTPATAPAERFHGQSLQKWRKDRHFGFTPSVETSATARTFGFTDEEIANPNAHAWALRRVPRALAYGAFSRLPLDTQHAMKAVVKRLLRRG